jgi:hypothetical protein
LPGFRVLESIGEDAVHKTGHRDLPTNPLRVENLNELRGEQLETKPENRDCETGSPFRYRKSRFRAKWSLGRAHERGHDAGEPEQGEDDESD